MAHGSFTLSEGLSVCIPAAALAVCLFAVFPTVASGQPLVPSLDVKPGQEIAFAATIVDGRVTLGPARRAKPGASRANAGEIVVSFVKHGLSPYAELTVTERTAAPVDFVATGLIGDIKIDEIVACGRLDAPLTARIGSGAWRVSLNRFAVHPGAGGATAGEGGLGCPR